MVAVGAVLSIFVTVAVVVAVLPSKSSNSKVKLPSVVKVYVNSPPLFVTVTSSLGMRVATTSLFVGSVVEYDIVPISGKSSSKSIAVSKKGL